MTFMDTKRYYPESAPLKKLIKYFWVSQSSKNLTLNHKILPVCSIDLIFNFLSPISYEKEGVIHDTPGNSFFSGLLSDHILMKQQGPILTIGVSFFPTGFYPFFKIPVSEFKNHTTGLDLVLKRPTEEIEQQLQETEKIDDKIRLLEHFFIGLLDQAATLPRDTRLLLNHFNSESVGVRKFCSNHGVHPRTLERMFNKYVGTTPKGFLRLNRFQTALNRMLNPRVGALTPLAHEFNFYDQAHFIKDFKSFTGSSPSRFLKEKNTVMQITNLT